MTTFVIDLALILAAVLLVVLRTFAGFAIRFALSGLAKT